MKNNTIKLLLLEFEKSADKINKAFRDDKITDEEYGTTLEALIANYDYKIREHIRKGIV